MAEDRKGPVIFGLPGTNDESAAAALSRMGGFSERDKDIALELAIRGLVSDAWRKPPPTATSTSPVTVPGNGWRDTGPLRPPPGINLIDAMVEAMQPHGPGNPARRGPPPAPAVTASPASASPAQSGPVAPVAAQPIAAGVVRRRLT